MFPVQGTLDRTILWIDKDNFKPSRDELSNTYCKKLLTAIISNWCLNNTVGTDLVRLPSEVWMHIFYYCVDRYHKSSITTISEIVSSSDLGVPSSIEKLKQRIEYEEMVELVLFSWA